jgi:hypothetical protein
VGDSDKFTAIFDGDADEAVSAEEVRDVMGGLGVSMSDREVDAFIAAGGGGRPSMDACMQLAPHEPTGTAPRLAIRTPRSSVLGDPRNVQYRESLW